MMSLYSQYMQEREGKSVIEQDHGFAVYSLMTDADGVPSIYLQDIFVEASHRKSGVAREMADIVSDIGKAQGCTRMYGTVAPAAKGSTTSLKVLLAYGFRLNSCNSELIAMVKDI